jgi:tetraacyldisaccharide-1-P 4'-kinase
VARIEAAAKAASAAIVMTTEKDAVRLAACQLGALPIASIPLLMGVEPPDRFRDWLLERLAASRQQPATSNQQPVLSPEPRAPSPL